IGALVRHRRLATDPLVAAHAPLLAEAARWIGHGAIRARGTIGGSLAHADPAAELPCAAVALGAELSVAGPGGARTLAAAEPAPQRREEAIAGLAAPCVELCEPAGDVHATADWRRAMVGVVATRALRDALRC